MASQRRKSEVGQRKSSRRKGAAETREPDRAELEALYRQSKERTDFAPPEQRDLETIFESEKKLRRGAEEGLTLGKYMKRRALNPPKFWLEDKGKTRHRATMTNKAYKGRKRFKLVALTKKQEEKLCNLIAEAEKEEEDGENVSPDAEAEAAPKELEKPSLTTPVSTPRLPLVQMSTPKTPTGKKEAKKNRRRSSLFKAVVTNEAARLQNEEESPSPAVFSPLKSSLSFKAPEQSSSPVGRRKTLKEVTEGELVQQGQQQEQQQHQQQHQHQDGEKDVESPMLPNEELRRQIEEADSLFGTVARERTTATSGFRRKSMVVRVRRSSRLRTGATSEGDAVGSVYEDAEVTLSRRRRRSIMDLHLATPSPTTRNVTEEGEEEEMTS